MAPKVNYNMPMKNFNYIVFEVLVYQKDLLEVDKESLTETLLLYCYGIIQKIRKTMKVKNAKLMMFL